MIGRPPLANGDVNVKVKEVAVIAPAVKPCGYPGKEVAGIDAMGPLGPTPYTFSTATANLCVDPGVKPGNAKVLAVPPVDVIVKVVPAPQVDGLLAALPPSVYTLY